MNKRKIIDQFIDLLVFHLEASKSAALATKDAATNEESRPENQYDTRALEASYLAGAQAHRVRELEAQVDLFRRTENIAYGQSMTIGPTALVEIQSGKQINYVLIMPQAGGMTIEHEKKTIQIVTPTSPLGEALVGLQTGDVAYVESAKVNRTYQIISVV